MSTFVNAAAPLKPAPRNFYKKIIAASIPAGRVWVSTRCVFHEDRNPSLSINLKSGGFFCHACGARGGDVIDFLRLRHSLNFAEAVKQLKNGATA